MHRPSHTSQWDEPNNDEIAKIIIFPIYFTFITNKVEMRNSISGRAYNYIFISKTVAILSPFHNV
jgi:hypothetical protein